MSDPDIVALAAARAMLPTPTEARRILALTDTTSAAVARQLAVSEATVCRWLAGTRRPKGERLVEYSQLLAELREVAVTGAAFRRASSGGAG